MITTTFCALIGLLVVCILGILATSVLTGKSILHILLEMRAFAEYNHLGCTGLIDDILARRHNKMTPIDKSGRIAVITGGTRGIGFELIKLLLQCKMNVIMGCRNVDDGRKVCELIRSQGITCGDLKIYELDTSSLESVRTFANAIKRDHNLIHYLINNAGIMFAPYKESVDGYESQFATNYLGHFLLTHLLLPEMKRAGSEDEYARIVNVSSCVYKCGRFTFSDINKSKMYVPFEAYAQSKLAQLLFTQTLNKLLLDEEARVQVQAVHPGVVNTELFANTIAKQYAGWLLKLFFKVPIEGAYPILYATISPKLERIGGIYITNCRQTEVADFAKNPRVEEKLFKFSKEITCIEHFGKV